MVIRTSCTLLSALGHLQIEFKGPENFITPPTYVVRCLRRSSSFGASTPTKSSLAAGRLIGKQLVTLDSGFSGTFCRHTARRHERLVLFGMANLSTLISGMCRKFTFSETITRVVGWLVAGHEAVKSSLMKLQLLSAVTNET
jgi:hypothetical protein